MTLSACEYSVKLQFGYAVCQYLQIFAHLAFSCLVSTCVAVAYIFSRGSLVGYLVSALLTSVVGIICTLCLCPLTLISVDTERHLHAAYRSIAKAQT